MDTRDTSAAASTRTMRLAGEGTKALPRKLAFTAKRLERLTCPAGRERVYVYDSKLPGFAYCIARGGGRAFYLLRKVNSRTVRYRLGDGALPVDEARRLAVSALATIARGIDPQQQKVEQRRRETLKAAFEDYCNRQAGKLKSLPYYADTFRRHAGRLASRPVDGITRQDVERHHADVGERVGRTTANRLLAVFSIIFNAAAVTPNPCRGIKRFREESRSRFLAPDELVRVVAAVDAEDDPQWRDYFKLLLATGARRTSVASMRWEDVDLPSRRWTVPSYMNKSGKTVTLPLTDDAVIILTDRWRHREASPFVFPSYGSTGHLAEPKSAWSRVCDRAGLHDVTVHDLRRTKGAYMASAGLSDRQIATALGQTTTAVVGVYARLRPDDALAASHRGDELMRRLMAEQQAAKTSKPKTSKSRTPKR